MARRFMTALALVGFIVMSASVIAAQEKEVEITIVADDESATPGERMPKLTDEQRAEIRDLREELRLKSIELRADLRKLGVTLKREMNKPEPDLGAIESVLKKMSVVRERLQMSRIEHRIAMKKLLGDNWRTHMRLGRRGRDGMWIEADDEKMERGGRGMRDVRVFRMRTPEAMPRGLHEKSPRMMRHPVSGHMRGFEHPRRVVKHRNMSHANRGSSCSAHRSTWESRMFRPRGKKTEAHRCAGECMHGEQKDMPAIRRRMRDSGGR